mgnify:CR=1 FL=1
MPGGSGLYTVDGKVLPFTWKTHNHRGSRDYFAYWADRCAREVGIHGYYVDEPYGEPGSYNVGVAANNVLPPENQRPDEDARFNVPTNGAPSPLYGAAPFSQQMLRFEEFGTEKLKFNKKKPKKWKELPEPADAQSAPDGDSGETHRSVKAPHGVLDVPDK